MADLATFREINGIGFDAEDGLFIVTLFKNGILVTEYEMPIASAKTLVKLLEKIVDREKPQ